MQEYDEKVSGRGWQVGGILKTLTFLEEGTQRLFPSVNRRSGLAQPDVQITEGAERSTLKDSRGLVHCRVSRALELVGSQK